MDRAVCSFSEYTVTIYLPQTVNRTNIFQAKRSMIKKEHPVYCRLIILFTIFILFNMAGAANDIRFQRLTITEGLSQSRIDDIIQDARGFLWIATEDGLNRYDGYEFNIYYNDPHDTTSIGDHNVMAMVADDSGNVWLGSYFGGLNRFDAAGETFGRYMKYFTGISGQNPFNIRAMAIDRDKNLWLASFGDGLYYFNIHSKEVTKYQHDETDPGSLQNTEINDLLYDSRGALWIATRGGLFRFYPGSKKFKQYSARPGRSDALSHPVITTLYEDRSGKIWIGTAGGGLNRFDPQTEKFANLQLDPDNQNESGKIVSAILEDRNGQLWVGTWGSGLYLIEKHTGKSRQFRYDPADITSISNDYIKVIFEDATGELWIGTDINGINKIDRAATRFKKYTQEPGNPNSMSSSITRAFWESPDGSLWIGTNAGLNKLDRKNGNFSHFLHDPSNRAGFNDEFVRALYQDPEGILWVGTALGLNRFDPVSEKSKRIYINPDNPGSQENFINYGIVESPVLPGELWIATSRAGLCRFNKTSGKIKRYLHDPNDPGSLNDPLNFVRSVNVSKKDPGILWVTGMNGFMRFDIRTEKFTGYSNDPDDPASLSGNNVLSVYEEPSGNLWVVTYGSGLNYFDVEQEKFTIYTTQNSELPSNSLYGIVPDDNGYLWMSHNRGLCKFDPRTMHFRNYTVKDGLQSDEFNGGAFYRSPAGELFFGGISGFNAFFPESITDDPQPPAIVLTDLKLFNESVKIGADAPLQKHISFEKEISLAHWQNDIALEFVALHFYRPVGNQYAYQLENYDTEWRYVGDQRSAVYTNLDPGQYIFRVKAANNDGIWNEKGLTLGITILPPWWRTTWAYILYGLIFIAAIFAFDRLQRMRLTQRERSRAQIREAELRAKAAEAQARAVQLENERKTRELEEARKLQLSMLPKSVPQLPHLEIAVYMKTATEVGGDYYDFSIAKEGTLNIVLGDATGHGMQAGTVVTLMKGFFSSDSSRMDIPSFFSQSSASLKNIQLGRMMMALTLLKIKDNRMIFSNAGMPPVYIYRRDPDDVEEIMFNDMPLGAMKAFEYQVREEEMARGDTVLLLSDGLPELKNGTGEMFEYERIRSHFEQVARRSPQDIIDQLVQAGEDWTNGTDLEDDITLMAIKFI